MERNRARIIIGAVLMLVCCAASASAHKPLLSLADQGDGVIMAEAGFSDGASAAGHKIIVKDEKTGAVISEYKVGEDGTVEIKSPSVPYTVTLDAGEGHVVTKAGFAPLSAPAVEKKAEAQASQPAPAPVAEKPVAVQPAPEKARVAEAPPAPSKQAVPEPAVARDQLVGVSPGAVVALQMMFVTQIVTATVVLILMAGCAFFLGYTMGKRSGATGRT